MDPDGRIPLDTIVDVASAIDSSVQVVKSIREGDTKGAWFNAGMLLIDVASLALPYVTGVSSGLKAARAADNVVDTGKIKNFKGIDVQQNNSLFDPNFVDKRGRTNIDRMEKGLAPIGVDGKSVNLHHVDQTMDGGVMEITDTQHKQKYSTLHQNTGQQPSQIDRPEFNKWRGEYWKSRAEDFN